MGEHPPGVFKARGIAWGACVQYEPLLAGSPYSNYRIFDWYGLYGDGTTGQLYQQVSYSAWPLFRIAWVCGGRLGIRGPQQRLNHPHHRKRVRFGYHRSNADFPGGFLKVAAGMLRKQHDRYGRRDLRHAPSRFDSVDALHLKIQDHNVGMQFFEHLDARLAVRRLAADFPFGICLQDGAQRFPHQFAIVHDQESRTHQSFPTRLVRAWTCTGAKISARVLVAVEIMRFSPSVYSLGRRR